MTRCKHTVYVDIFALYIFSRYSLFSNIREDICNLKITCIMPHRDYMWTKTRVLVHAKLPIFVNSRRFVHAKISTFTVYTTLGAREFSGLCIYTSLYTISRTGSMTYFKDHVFLVQSDYFFTNKVLYSIHFNINHIYIFQFL